MAKWHIRSLTGDHRRDSFDCGKPSLDQFLRTLARQYEKRGLGRTYVATQADDATVCGYYTIASGSVDFRFLPPDVAKRLPKHSVPVALLGRLAVDKRFQGQRLGATLLRDALVRCFDISRQIGINAVEVYSLDENAKQFYKRFDFAELLDDPLHLYLAIKTIEKGINSKL